MTLTSKPFLPTTSRVLRSLLLLSVPGLILAAQTSQTIVFDAIPNEFLGISPIVVTAHATSGLPVTLVSASPSVCTTAGDLVTLLNTGICSVKATQAGNTTYITATPLTRSFTVAVAKASSGFSPASGSAFGTGTTPGSIAVADFNGDGLLDLAVTNTGDGTVTVLEATGFGGFGTPAGNPFATGKSPKAIVTGDFNGDGKADLAIANSGDNTITVLLGNGAGGFTPAPGSPFSGSTGSQPVSLAIGDFNSDGIQDLAVVYAGNSIVQTFLGSGTGSFTFTTGGSFTVGTNPSSVAVGDFNGDGNDDLAIANSGSNSVSVMLGNGSDTFTAASGSPLNLGGSVSAPASVVVGDFNGDGILDLAVANSGSGNVAILLGIGGGGFAASPGSPFNTGAQPASLVVGDFNGDGVADLAVANSGSNSILIMTGDGSGTFSAGNAPITVGTAPLYVAAADFNNDGVLDLASANSGNKSVSVLLGIPASASTAGRLTLSVAHNPEIGFGSPVATTFVAAGGSPPYVWTAARLPDGVSIDSQTGILTGTPTAPGNTNINVAVLDSSGTGATVSPTISVLGFTNSNLLPNATTGSAYSVALTAAGGTPPYTFATAAGSSLPPGLTLQNGTLSGTPAAIGNYNFAIQLSDSTGFSTSVIYSILVSGTSSSLQVIGGSLLGGTAGVPYSQGLTATGGAPPYTWTLIGGTLPPGLSLDSPSGTVSGTPPLARTSVFTALATDSAGAKSSGVFTIVIAPTPLTLSGVPFAPGVTGISYPPQLLSASGGVGPYTFSVSGALPAGLVLKNGAVTGIPTTPALSISR